MIIISHLKNSSFLWIQSYDFLQKWIFHCDHLDQRIFVVVTFVLGNQVNVGHGATSVVWPWGSCTLWSWDQRLTGSWVWICTKPQALLGLGCNFCRNTEVCWTCDLCSVIFNTFPQKDSWLFKFLSPLFQTIHRFGDHFWAWNKSWAASEKSCCSSATKRVGWGGSRIWLGCLLALEVFWACPAGKRPQRQTQTCWRDWVPSLWTPRGPPGRAGECCWGEGSGFLSWTGCLQHLAVDQQ